MLGCCILLLTAVVIGHHSSWFIICSFDGQMTPLPNRHRPFIREIPHVCGCCHFIQEHLDFIHHASRTRSSRSSSPSRLFDGWACPSSCWSSSNVSGPVWLVWVIHPSMSGGQHWLSFCLVAGRQSHLLILWWTADSSLQRRSVCLIRMVAGWQVLMCVCAHLLSRLVVTT